MSAKRQTGKDMADRAKTGAAVTVCAINLALWVIAGTTAAQAAWLALAGIGVNIAGIILFTTLFISSASRPVPVPRQQQPLTGGGGGPGPRVSYTTYPSPYAQHCAQRTSQPPAQTASDVPPSAAKTLLWAFQERRRP